MARHHDFYRRLPGPLQTVARRGYYAISNETPFAEFREQFVADFFDSHAAYETYVDEFERGDTNILREAAPVAFDRIQYGVDETLARDYYALIRAQRPEIVVETGVCNGVSTLAVLLALERNGSGRLHSIDYPLRADESLDEFRRETFDEYGGAAIPADKDPGWIVPERLHSRWNLVIGKSQRELPRLLSDIDSVDVFHHDSEHSHPCQMFELELAFEWVGDGGAILCDDIRWTDAFETFTAVRDAHHGRLSYGTGYIKR